LVSLDDVIRLRAEDDSCLERAPSSHRDDGTAEIVPDTKSSITRGAVLFGSKAVTAKLEVVVDPAMNGQDALHMAC